MNRLMTIEKIKKYILKQFLTELRTSDNTANGVSSIDERTQIIAYSLFGPPISTAKC